MLKRDLCDDAFRYKELESFRRKSPENLVPAVYLDDYREITAAKECVTFPITPREINQYLEPLHMSSLMGTQMFFDS